MSVTIRPQVTVGWEEDIRVQLHNATVIRERKKAQQSEPSSRLQSGASGWFTRGSIPRGPPSSDEWVNLKYLLKNEPQSECLNNGRSTGGAMEGIPGIPTRYRLRVKQRLAVVEYVRRYGIKPASRQFGLARPTVRQWWRNWQRAGIQGLVPQYPARRRRRIGDDVVALITQARLEHQFGASRARIWLERVHHVRVATETIQRVFRDIGVPHLVKTRRRRPKQLKLFEKERPGDSVQVDVKVVARGRSKWFQYTAIDDCTRVRVLRLYRRQNHRSSLAFLRELTAAFPFQIRKIQVDNGTEFPLLFALTCQELGVRVRYIRPRRPEQNGKVERSHRIDEEEFRGRYAGQDFDAATDALAVWEYRYNHERFSMALRGRTPMEKLAAMLAPPLVMARAPDSVQ